MKVSALIRRLESYKASIGDDEIIISHGDEELDIVKIHEGYYIDHERVCDIKVGD